MLYPDKSNTSSSRMADAQFEMLMMALMSQKNEERRAANSADMTVRSMGTVILCPHGTLLGSQFTFRDS